MTGQQITGDREQDRAQQFPPGIAVQAGLVEAEAGIPKQMPKAMTGVQKQRIEPCP